MFSCNAGGAGGGGGGGVVTTIAATTVPTTPTTTTSSCTQTCENSGSQNSACECLCLPLYSGQFCEIGIYH